MPSWTNKILLSCFDRLDTRDRHFTEVCPRFTSHVGQNGLFRVRTCQFLCWSKPYMLHRRRFKKQTGTVAAVSHKEQVKAGLLSGISGIYIMSQSKWTCNLELIVL